MSRREYRRMLCNLRSAILFVDKYSLPSWRCCCRMPFSTLRQWLEKLEKHLILWGPYSEDLDEEDGQGVRTWIHRRWQNPSEGFHLNELARHFGCETEAELSSDMHRTGKLYASLLNLLFAREEAAAKRLQAPLPIIMARPLQTRRVRPAKRQKPRRF